MIEDAACALGSEIDGRRCGSLGTLGCFSFHPRKLITTGEGGMVTTDDDALAERLRSYRSHGMVHANGATQFAHAGLNYRLTDFQAALGIGQMGRLPKILDLRQRLAQRYQELLADCPGVTLPLVPSGYRTNWQAYVVMLADELDRDASQRRMREHGIETSIGTYACSAQPAYEKFQRPCPQSLRAQRQSLALPLHGRMTQTEVQTVVDHLRAVIS